MNRVNRIRALNRNILLYRLLLVLGANGLMTPVIYFFFTSLKGFTPSQALFLVGLATLTKAFSEVPTGVVADKFSRKYSVFAGYSILLVSSLGLLVMTGFWPILQMMLLSGVGGSFISGADDALLYDTLKELKRTDEFKAISGLSESIELVAFATTIAIGGLLGGIDLQLPLGAHIVLLALSVLISHLLIEPLVSVRGEKIEQVGYLLHARQSIENIVSKSGLKSGLLGSFVSLALILAVFKSTKIILSPILGQYGFTVSVIGMITSAIILVKALGAFVASKVARRGNETKEAVFSLALCIAGLVMITLIQTLLVQLVIFVFIVSLDNVILINLKAIVNEKIESRQRSTILSLLSLLARSTEMLFLTSFGWIIGAYPLKAAVLFTVVWLTFSMLVLAFFAYKKHEK